MAEPARPSAPFRVATLPARLLGRYRGDLRISLREDAETFGGPAVRFFLVLALLAVAYPIVASLVHAQAPVPPRKEWIESAISPFFFQVYAESLPFMIAAAGIGAYSPGLGVLFIALFIPADLAAAAVHCGGCGSGGPPELVPPQGMEMWRGPIVARLISYALLWILAVEIPLRVRRLAIVWAGSGGRQPFLPVTVGAVMAGTAVLVFFWANALPLLVQPVLNWTVLQQFTIEATNATWTYWPILVIGATAIAGVSAIWPKPVRAVPDPPSFAPSATSGVTSMGRTLVRQTLAVLVLAALLAGLLTNLLEAAILIGGLLVAGPVVTVLLPRLRAPRWVPPARSMPRWIIAMVVALALSRVILNVAGDAVGGPYLLLVLTLAIVAPIFRVLLELGARSSSAEADTRGPRTGPPPAVVISTLVLLALVLWLALPAMALADNWTDPTELKQKLSELWNSGLGMIGGALAAVGALLGGLQRDFKRADDFFQGRGGPGGDETFDDHKARKKREHDEEVG